MIQQKNNKNRKETYVVACFEASPVLGQSYRALIPVAYTDSLGELKKRLLDAGKAAIPQNMKNDVKKMESNYPPIEVIRKTVAAEFEEAFLLINPDWERVAVNDEEETGKMDS